MGFVTNDPKKSDDQQPGGLGLSMDLGLKACPQCRREVPEWQADCPECGVQAVPSTELRAVMPDIPAHLLEDDEEDDATGPDGARTEQDQQVRDRSGGGNTSP